MTTQQQQQSQPNSGILPSLADLDKPNPQSANPDSPAGDSNDPAKKPADTPDPNNPAAAAPGDDKPAATDDKGDGTPADDTTDVSDDDNPMSFWDEVTKLRGDDIKWEFPQDIDPTTPAGVHHAIKLAAEREVDNWERTLQQEDPRAYAYMLHRANGGDDETFFGTKTEVLPDAETLKGSVDLQQQFYKRSLTRKGVLPEQADLLVKDAVEKNQLAALALAERQAQDEASRTQLAELQRITQLKAQREEAAFQQMGTTLQERILQNKDMPITIPDAKRAEFLQFVNSMMMYDRQTGQWYMNQQVTNESMPKLLSAMYYLHVGGNLEQIIAQKAQAKNIQQMKLKMQSDKQKKSSQADPNRPSGGNKPGVQPAMSEL